QTVRIFRRRRGSSRAADALMIGKRGRLNERRRIVRLPRTVDVTPLPDVAGNPFDARGALGYRQLNGRVHRRVPAAVRQLVDLIEGFVGESDEHRAVVAAVGLDERGAIPVLTLDDVDRRGHAPVELLAEAGAPFLDERLMEVAIDRAAWRDGQRR